jgi:hypothetical protein
VNDISLPKGGVFDLQNDWNQFARSHSEHRDGRDIDINPAGINCLDDLALQAAVNKFLVPLEHRITNVQQPDPASALLCETGGRKHIDITALVPQ